MGPVQIWPRLYFAARFPTEATPSASRGPGPGEPLVSYGEVDRSMKRGPVSERQPVSTGGTTMSLMSHLARRNLKGGA